MTALITSVRPAVLTRTFAFKEPATYQGMEVIASREVAFTFREDGWFNMTKAAKAFGKVANEFLRLPSTLEYIRAVESLGKIPTLFTTQGGWHLNPDVGTWAHPKLAVFFARWLDVRFAVWCDAMIDDILKGNAAVVITKPAESAVLALNPPPVPSGTWEAEPVRFRSCPWCCCSDT